MKRKGSLLTRETLKKKRFVVEDSNSGNYPTHTLTGSDKGFSNGDLGSARYHNPVRICMDVSTETIYLSDYNNHRIRKISNGVVSVLAGSTPGNVDGRGALAKLNHPYGLCFDPVSKCVIFCDSKNYKLRKIDLDGNVTSFVGSGTGGYEDGKDTDAKFSRIDDICFDDINRILYVCDRENHCIRSIDEDGNVLTYTGSESGYNDGPIAEALFNKPTGICFDRERRCLFVCDRYNHRIRMIDRYGIVSTIAGGEEGYVDGPGECARFRHPVGICVDDVTGNLFISDRDNFRIRMINNEFLVSTISGGTQGYADGNTAEFRHTWGICFDPVNRRVLICDSFNHRIRYIHIPATVRPLTLVREETEYNLQIPSSENVAIDIHQFVFQARLTPELDLTLFETISYDMIQILIDYLYYDKLICNLDLEGLFELMKSFEHFRLKHFQYLIILEMENQLSHDNVLTYLHFMKKNKWDHNLNYALRLFKESVEEMNQDSIKPDMFDTFVWASTSKIERYPPIEPVKSNFIADFQKISSLNFTDTILVVTDVWGQIREYPCHKAIIAANSHFFKGFFNFEPEKREYHHSSPLSLDVFDHIMDCWYGLKFEDDSFENSVFFLVWGDMYLSTNNDELTRLYKIIFRGEKSNNSKLYEYLTIVKSKYTIDMISQILDSTIIEQSELLARELEHILENKTIKSNNPSYKELQDSLTSLHQKTSEEISSLKSQIDIMRETLSYLQTNYESVINSLKSKE